nr:Dihydrofolate reductase [uncultured bacterium]
MIKPFLKRSIAPETHTTEAKLAYNDKTESITLVAAIDQALAIGREGKLLWPRRLQADMDHFVSLTMGHTVAMGRKTYESISRKYRPLEGRDNWILTRDSTYSQPGCRIFHDVDEVLRAYLGRDLFIAGGGEVYRLFLPHATRLVITHVDTRVEDADTFFPELPTSNWSQRVLFRHNRDERNDFPFSVVEYTQIDEF